MTQEAQQVVTPLAALKLVLARLESMNHADSIFAGEFDFEIKAIKEALAQHDSVQAKPEPEQEPVAWVVYSSAENDIVWADKGKLLKQNTPLYTNPPQRTWVGLTDEEAREIQTNMVYGNHSFIKVIQAIEAKLKQKNGYAEENT